MDQQRWMALDRDAARRLFAARGSEDIAGLITQLEQQAPPDHLLEGCPESLAKWIEQRATLEGGGMSATRELLCGGNLLAESSQVGQARMVRPDLLPHALGELHDLKDLLNRTASDQGATLALLGQLTSLVELAVANGHCIVSRSGL